MKIILKITTRILTGLLILTLGMLLILWMKSSGTAVPIVDENGNPIPSSISIIEEVNIGGIEQSLIIRGVNTSQPILLYLHGGPGQPEFPFMRDEALKLEEEFVVVYWEQRGSAKSYSSNIPLSSMTLNQFIEDAAEVSQYLKQRFQQDKLFLMGHSWGSLLGILTAQKYPQHFHSFIGVGQVVSQFRAELLSFGWVKEQAVLKGDDATLQAMTDLGFPDSLASNQIWLDYLFEERKHVFNYGGGISRKPTNMWWDFGIKVLSMQEYTVIDKLNYLRGSFFSLGNMWRDLVETNLFMEIDSLHLPVHFIHGKYDYQTPYELTHRFYEQLPDSLKHFHTFENSAHYPFLDEPKRFNEVVREIKANWRE